jgi:hypothetical protein
MRLTDLSFEEWIEHAFSREVHIQHAAWYFDPNHDWWDPKPVEAVEVYATAPAQYVGDQCQSGGVWFRLPRCWVRDDGLLASDNQTSVSEKESGLLLGFCGAPWTVPKSVPFEPERQAARSSHASALQSTHGACGVLADGNRVLAHPAPRRGPGIQAASFGRMGCGALATIRQFSLLGDFLRLID